MSENNPDVTISVVVDQETQVWLKQKAKTEDRSVSSVVRAIISEYREKQGQVVNLSLSREAGSV